MSNSSEQADSGMDNSESVLSGDAPESFKTAMITMQKQIADNQKAMCTLTQTVKNLNDNIQASTSAANGSSTGQERKRKPLDETRKEAAKQRKKDHEISDNDSDSGAEQDGFDELVDESSDRDDGADDGVDPDALLEELSECFGSDEKCSEPIYDKLAKVANEGMRTKLNMDKIKELTDKYNRPKNVENLVTPKVNGEIWPHINRKIKSQDVRLQKTQSLICKAIVPQLQQLDMLLQSKKKGGEAPSSKDLIRLAMDSLKLMTFVYCDMSYRRRELIIQPDKNEEFKPLCSNDHPVTDNLFGDDLGKVVEDIVKGNKVGSKISGGDRKPVYKKNGGHGYKSSYNRYNNGGSNGKQTHFLGQRSTQHFRKKNQQFKQRK